MAVAWSFNMSTLIFAPHQAADMVVWSHENCRLNSLDHLFDLRSGSDICAGKIDAGEKVSTGPLASISMGTLS